MMSVTPDQSKKVGLGMMTASPSLFFTPRPERRRHDSRGSDRNSNRQDKDRETNVQVLLRCRPLSDDEQKSNVPRVVSCNENKREVTVVQTIANKQVDRVFTFDKFMQFYREILTGRIGRSGGERNVRVPNEECGAGKNKVGNLKKQYRLESHGMINGCISSCHCLRLQG